MRALHHIDGNPHNNDPANLRIVETSANVSSPAPHRDPWRSAWLNWLEEVQTLCGLRAYCPATYRQLVARHSVGETTHEAADWLLTRAPNQAWSPSQKRKTA